jgi:hypothetical protein
MSTSFQVCAPHPNPKQRADAHLTATLRILAEIENFQAALTEILRRAPFPPQAPQQGIDGGRRTVAWRQQCELSSKMMICMNNFDGTGVADQVLHCAG